LSIRTGLSLLLVLGLICARVFAASGPYYINATNVNLRESPEGEIVLTLDLNDKVFVVKSKDGWSYVSAPVREAKGWVWAEYISKEKVDSASRTAKAQPAEQAKAGEQQAKPADEEKAVHVELAPSAPTPAPAPKRAPTPAATPPAGKAASAAQPVAPVVDDVSVQDGQPVPVVETPLKEIRRTGLDDVLASTLPPATGAQNQAAGAQSQAAGAQSQAAEVTVFTFDDQKGGTAPPAVPQADLATPAAAQQQESAQFAALQMPSTPVDVDVPELTGLGKCYKPVGGHDLALISGTDVNVRESADLKSKTIGKVDKGDKVYILCVDDPWYYVSIPGDNLKGWVFGEYVSALSRIEITGDQVRLREEPSPDARIKDELNKGDVFFEFQRKNKWVLVASSSSGMKGWVHQDYVKKTERAASRPFKVTGEGINFRTSANVDSDIIAQLPQGTTVQVLGRNDKWSFIEYSGQQGWMYSQYLNPNFKGAPKAIYGKNIGDRLIKRAKAMEGTPYVWGGESDDGVDCSGLIYKVLLDEGADASSLPRRASTQMAGLGQPVDKEDLLPGDLVFFTTYKAGASHVGIYLGDGDFIHASSAQSKVTVSNLSEGYYKQRFVGARRISEEELKRGK
jgi:cell wall-associated NlpC family hydrolase